MPTDNIVRLHRPRPCPICGKPSSQQFHPFCSARCQDIDLNRWLSGAYVIPGEALEEEDVPQTRSDKDEE
jgi:endogenous inhibitor of DNA gyrase (YacG/DUF329 family)